MKRILVCCDGSEHAAEAARHAAALAKSFGATLLVLHVFELPVAPYPGIAGLTSPELLAPPGEEAQTAIVAPAFEAIREEGIPFEDLRRSGLSAAEVILKVAEEEQADLLVLGSRGLGAVKRFFIGSVSDRVVHHAHCDVLVVK